MRLRTHLVASTLVGLSLYPRSPARAALVVAGGVLIDVDHLVLYMLQTGDYSLVGALVYDRYRNRPSRTGDTRPRYGSLRSWLHQPLLMPLLVVVAATAPRLRPLALGLLLHLFMDHFHAPLRWPLLWRAHSRCELCGTPSRRLRVHHVVHPLDGGRWHPDNEVVLCRSCHRRAARSYPVYPPA